MNKTACSLVLAVILAQACATAPPTEPVADSAPLYSIQPTPPPELAPEVAPDDLPLVPRTWVQDAPLPAGDSPAQAQAPAPKSPWDKWAVSGGVLLTAMDTGVRVGPAGLGVAVNLEELLGFDTTTTSARLQGSWRFTENRKHRVSIAWVDLSRDGKLTLQQDLDLGNGNILPAGSNVETSFGLNLFKTQYSYSFFQDERFDLAGAVGLYVAPMDFSLSATGLTTYSDSFNVTAPLPLLGLRMDFAVTPKWYLRSDLSLFYLEFNDYTGAMRDVTAAVEYRAWEHFAIGLGFDSFGLTVEKNGSTSIPGVGFVGEVNYEFTGLMLYLKGLW